MLTVGNELCNATVRQHLPASDAEWNIVEFPAEIIERIRATGVLATFSVHEVDHAVPLVRALMAGGIDTIELTLRTPAAMDALVAICHEVPEVLVGVGTVLSPDQVSAVKKAGVAFGVAPGLNLRVVDAAREMGLPFAPGIATPSDLEAAAERGCRLMKFFPAEPSGGVGYLKSLTAPYQHLGIEYIPLGGINAGNMRDYLAQPQVLAVGGTWLVQQEIVERGDWQRITNQAAEVVKWLSETPK
ncbi:MAG: bifunctional 4-hydroxy-2-oxoglutarate aldolase/2-dehydro-3-deoxy-phosphogluconate aldolase [Planctomycetota bacterium]